MCFSLQQLFHSSSLQVWRTFYICHALDSWGADCTVYVAHKRSRYLEVIVCRTTDQAEATLEGLLVLHSSPSPDAFMIQACRSSCASLWNSCEPAPSLNSLESNSAGPLLGAQPPCLSGLRARADRIIRSDSRPLSTPQRPNGSSAKPCDTVFV
jgi:hypothetical protein